MALYNVVGPCIVTVDGEDKHYTGPHPDPVEVSDAASAELVKAGQLEPVTASKPSEPEAENVPPPRRPRSSSHTEEE